VSVLALAVHAAQPAQKTHTIVIENMQFNPPALEVAPGDRIVWRNQDLVPHTATAAGSFDSGTIEAGKTWATVVAAPGTIAYVCTLHPTMKASLTVR